LNANKHLSTFKIVLRAKLRLKKDKRQSSGMRLVLVSLCETCLTLRFKHQLECDVLIACYSSTMHMQREKHVRQGLDERFF